MISGQRKAHYIIWILIAICVPVFMFLSVKGLDFDTTERESPVTEKVKKGNLLKTSENEFMKANVYNDHLEIILKLPLKNASTIVYNTDENGKRLNSVGQITASGIYTFKINDELLGVALYDAIKETEITKILF